jgi:hypothetical protein
MINHFFRHFLNYSRDHSVAEGLAEAVTWNAAMLNTEVFITFKYTFSLSSNTFLIRTFQSLFKALWINSPPSIQSFSFQVETK